MKTETIIIVICVFYIPLFVTTSKAQPESVLMQTYFDNLQEKNYNPKIPPTGNGGYGNPIHVFAELFLLDIYKVDDTLMDYRASFYFRQCWNDSRLAYDEMDISSIITNDASMIWTPDLFFVQEKEGHHHNIITNNVFVRISPEGEVRYSIRLSMTFTCPMDFRKYPHDVQKCEFSVESYGRSRDQLMLDWDNRTTQPVAKAESINVLPFELIAIGHTTKNVDLTFGKYRALIVSLTLKRKVGFYLTRLYVPFIFLVVLSWLSFWIKAKFAILRMSLLLVILYLMISIGSDISNYIPPAPYTKASDVWIAVCESLVFGAFLEFILVSILIKSEKKSKKKICSSDAEAPIITGSNCKEKCTSIDSEKRESAIRMIASRLSYEVKASKRVNAMASILFPVLFIVFNFLYFLIY